MREKRVPEGCGGGGGHRGGEANGFGSKRSAWVCLTKSEEGMVRKKTKQQEEEDLHHLLLLPFPFRLLSFVYLLFDIGRDEDGVNREIIVVQSEILRVGRGVSSSK